MLFTAILILLCYWFCPGCNLITMSSAPLVPRAVPFFQWSGNTQPEAAHTNGGPSMASAYVWSGCVPCLLFGSPLGRTLMVRTFPIGYNQQAAAARLDGYRLHTTVIYQCTKAFDYPVTTTTAPKHLESNSNCSRAGKITIGEAVHFAVACLAISPPSLDSAGCRGGSMTDGLT